MNFQNYPYTNNNQYYIQNPQQYPNTINFPNQSQIQNIYNLNPIQGFNSNIIQKQNIEINNNTNNTNLNNSNNSNNSNNINIFIDKPKKPKKNVKFTEKVDILLVESYKEYNKIDEELYNNFYGNEEMKDEVKKKVDGTTGKNCECIIL